MPDITRIQNFNDGDLVTANKLKNLIDNSSINTTFLTDKTALAENEIADTDQFLVYDASALIFKKINLLTHSLGTAGMTGRDYKVNPYGVGGVNYEVEHGVWAKASESGNLTYTGILVTGDATTTSNWTLPSGAVRAIGQGQIRAFGGLLNAKVGRIDLFAHAEDGGDGAVSIEGRSSGPTAGAPPWNIWNVLMNGDEFYFRRQYVGYLDGVQTGGQPYQDKMFFEVNQVLDNAGDEINEMKVTIRDRVDTPKLDATEVNATTYKKAGTSTVFPLKRGYREYEWGTWNGSFTNIPNSTFASGYNGYNSFAVNALTGGGLLIWETINSFKLESNETYLLKFDIWHDDLSTAAGAYCDYRLRLKAKTVGAAVYATKEIAVVRDQIAYYGGAQHHRPIFKISRSDFPSGSEDVTRQLQLVMSEGISEIALKHYIIKSEAELWNTDDLTAGTTALL